VEATEPVLFTASQTAEVGRELGTPVLPGVQPGSTELNADIKWVELTAGGDDHSHLIEPDDIIHMVLTRQRLQSAHWPPGNRRPSALSTLAN
jgi:hypothetical protein